MSYKIILDSAAEFTDEMRADSHFARVPLTLLLDGVETVDDESFDQADMLKRVAASKDYARSQCPAPGAFMEYMEGEEDRIYIITLSSNISGSFNAALAVKTMIEEDYPDKRISIIDSRSASVALTMIGLKIQEWENQGLDYDTIVKKATAFRKSQKTYFVLETLDTFIKNGRISHLKGTVASVLNIKPVMAATSEGTITQLGQARGIPKALKKMTELAVLDHANMDVSDRTLAICHCNCEERAIAVRDDIMKMLPFKDCIILPAAGISTIYANDGGIILNI